MPSSNSLKLSKQEYIKQRTIELYNQLPDDEEGRKCRLDIRDEVIELNYTFFGYVATHTYINNSSVTYEDKFQSALTHFCECWWWYRWAQRYRTDLSFSVFFKPRIGEMIERELNDVKYSVRRSLCMEVGAQIGKHWGQVRYEDLADPRVKLSTDKMNSLKAMFGTLYWADLSEHELYMEAPQEHTGVVSELNDQYDSIEDFLIHEMITEEKKLTDDDLEEMANMYQIDFITLRRALPKAEERLYHKLHFNLDLFG